MIDVGIDTLAALRQDGVELVVRVQIASSIQAAGSSLGTHWNYKLYGSGSGLTDQEMEEAESNRVLAVGDSSRSVGYLLEDYEAGSAVVTLDNTDGWLPGNFAPEVETWYGSAGSKYATDDPQEWGFVGAHALISVGPVIRGTIPEWIDVFGGAISDVEWGEGEVSLTIVDQMESLIAREITETEEDNLRSLYVFTDANPVTFVEDVVTDQERELRVPVLSDTHLLTAKDAAAFTAAETTMTNLGLLITIPDDTIAGMSYSELLKEVGRHILGTFIFNESGSLMPVLIDPLPVGGEDALDFREGETLYSVRLRQSLSDVANTIEVSWGTEPNDTGTETTTETFSEAKYGVPRTVSLSTPWLTNSSDANILAQMYRGVLAGYGGVPWIAEVEVGPLGLVVELNDPITLYSATENLSGEVFRVIGKTISESGQRVGLKAVRTSLEYSDWAFTILHNTDDDKLVF